MIENTGIKVNIDKINTLENENSVLKHELEIANEKIKWYEEQFRLAASKKYGKSSDVVPGEQLSMFNDAEITARPDADEPEIEKIIYERKKQKRGANKESYEDLRVETITYELPIGERECSVCGNDLHVMTKEIRKELQIKPAEVFIVEHVKEVYSCRTCEKSSDKTPIVKASAPNPVLPGSIVSASMLAYLMYQKYVAAMPLNRQEMVWNDMGVQIPKQNMANWIIKGSDLWLEPLYERMHKFLLEENYIHADESPLRVLTKDGKPTDSKSYMWLYMSSEHSKKQMALYEYQPSRSGKHAKAFLQGFSGFLQTDDYAGYNSVESVTRIGCLAHARRYFTDAIKALPKDVPIESTFTYQALEYFKEIFKIEGEFKGLDITYRYKLRQEKLIPKFESYLSWLQGASLKVVPKSTVGKAINYSLSNWEYLINSIKVEEGELTNNRAERAIKPFVIGRKNYLFAKSPNGARASAVIYSVVESAKLNGLNPYYYIKYLLEQLPQIKLTSEESIDHLLPWSNTLPEECTNK